MYEQQQRQRELERRVRASKRECAGLNTAVENADTDADKAYFKREFDKAAVLLKKREGALNAYCESTGRTYLADRTMVGGFNRSVSSKAVWGAKNPKMSVKLQLFGKPDYTKQPVSSLAKSVNSLERQIDFHRGKISNPEAYIPNWNSFENKHKDGIINHWSKEIKNFEKQISDITDEINKR